MANYTKNVQDFELWGNRIEIIGDSIVRIYFHNRDEYDNLREESNKIIQYLMDESFVENETVKVELFAPKK